MSQTAALRVMQVLPRLDSGGVERGTIDIHAALVKDGHVAVCVSSGGKLVGQLEAIGGEHLTLPVQSKNPLRMLVNAFRLARIIRDKDIGLVHVRSRAPAWSGLLACKITSTPMVTTFHGQYGSHNRAKRTYNSAMLRGERTIAVSNFIAQHIRDSYAQMSPSITTIFRGIDLTAFDPDNVSIERQITVLKQWKIDPEQRKHFKIILLPGRMTRLKGHACFIRALSKLGPHPYKAIMMGESHGRERYLDELKALAASLGVQPQVQFVGACDDMPAAYKAADIVVSASTKPEAFGRTSCEAQAMEKLVVATNHGGSIETICPEQKDGLCAPDDPDAMAAALRHQLEQTSAMAKSTGSAGRAHIARYFSLENMCRETLDLYREVSDAANRKVDSGQGSI